MVLDVKGNQLRLGFTAPPNVAIHREEVYERIQTERVDNTLQSGATVHGSTPCGCRLPPATILGG